MASELFASNSITTKDLNLKITNYSSFSEYSSGATYSFTANVPQFYLKGVEGANLKYSLIYVDSKLADKIPIKTFNVKDYLNSSSLKKELQIESNTFSVILQKNADERKFYFALFAEDLMTVTIAAYYSNSVIISALEAENDSSGLAWYFVILIVIAAITIIGFTILVVFKYVCKR